MKRVRIFTLFFFKIGSRYYIFNSMSIRSTISHLNKLESSFPSSIYQLQVQTRDSFTFKSEYYSIQCLITVFILQKYFLFLLQSYASLQKKCFSIFIINILNSAGRSITKFLFSSSFLKFYSYTVNFS